MFKNRYPKLSPGSDGALRELMTSKSAREVYSPSGHHGEEFPCSPSMVALATTALIAGGKTAVWS